MSQTIERHIHKISLSNALDLFSDGIAGHSEILGLSGGSKAWFLANLLTRTMSSPPLLVVASDQPKAQSLYEALTFFYGTPSEILFFPQWETEPYAFLSPHPEVEATRMATLSSLAVGKGRAVVTTVNALQQKVIPKHVISSLLIKISVGDTLERDKLLHKLVLLGYQNAQLVEDRGSYAVRGELVDIFPPMLDCPIRLVFFGDELEEIRFFDPDTQRSSQNRLNSLELVPAREMILAGEQLDTFTKQFKKRCDDLEISRTRREEILEELRNGWMSPGRENLLALNYDSLDPLFQYLPKFSWILVDPSDIAVSADQFSDAVQKGEERCALNQEPFVPSADFYLKSQDVERSMSLGSRIDLTSLQIYQINQDRPVYQVMVTSNSDLRPENAQHDGSLSQLAQRLQNWQDNRWRILIVCHQHSQEQRLLDLLSPYELKINQMSSLVQAPEIPLGINIIKAPLTDGFRLLNEKLALICDDEIFGPRKHRRNFKTKRAFETSLADLKVDDHVVHADYGIGRYLGLVHIQTEEVAGDYLHLEYAGQDRLYLPIERIEKIQKYLNEGTGTPRLDKMGSGAWEKAKLKARACVEELARDLLKIQARRQMAKGFVYSPPDPIFREFEASFPHEETPDQMEAIDAVLGDMISDRPVDRLICGDVGYGKTEVAIRSALKAVLDGRQVAVLVPTTVLARQHFETFSKRFKDYPVVVEMLSRFRTPSEQKRIIQRTSKGQVDILIGTHRLLQRDLRFKSLGLVVVDEEQRFGVTHKERLKKMRAEVDMIALTATPIPRTLHMSLTGLRDLSIIDTPPVDRLAIRTYVTRFDDYLIREAILRELKRGGQVYFVHNRVQSIDAMEKFIKQLVPEAKVEIGHGQMPEKDLEKVMLNFIAGKTNVLLCTTIIENGIDIPAANTIIINRADCFGLAQLYQLRGRVGRSFQRAYAYLLIPGEGSLTKEARDRLKVLQEQAELGAGFRIARHDLELRGAGDLLGSKQAGQVAAVGFEMYNELLEETINELKGMRSEELIDPEVRLGLSAYLPENYIADPNQRLVLYRKMASAKEDIEIYQLIDELQDRYGGLPQEAQTLLEVMKLRIIMKRLRIETLEYDGYNLILSFPASTNVSPDQIMERLKKRDIYKFSPDYRLSIRIGRIPKLDVLSAAKKELQAFCQL